MFSDWCIHYNGLLNASCKAGIVYKEVFGGTPGLLFRVPCTPKGRENSSCIKLQLPTQEQSEKEEKDFATYIKNVGKAVIRCRLHAQTHNDPQGQVTCPVCFGRLRYRIARRNKHVSGICETKGCLKWVQ